MASRLAHQKDIVAGVLYILVGAGFAIGALAYRMGTAARMGPGYLPFWLGAILSAIGVLIIITAMLGKTSPEHVERWDLKSLFLILGPVVLFSILLEPMG